MSILRRSCRDFWPGIVTVENLDGLIVQATPFNKALLPATGATKID